MLNDPSKWCGAIAGACLVLGFLVPGAAAAPSVQDGVEARVEKLSADLNRIATALEKSLDLDSAMADAKSRCTIPEASESAIRELLQSWRNAWTSGRPRGAAPVNMSQFESLAVSSLGKDGGRAFIEWLKAREAETAKGSAELERVGRELGEILVSFSTQSAAHSIHAQEELQRAFEAAMRVASAAEQELRLRAETLSRPIAEKLALMRDLLDVDTSLAVAKARWQWAKEKSEIIRKFIVDVREGELAARTDAEHNAMIDRMITKVRETFPERDGEEFYKWLSGRANSVRKAVVDLQKDVAALAKQWSDAASRASASAPLPDLAAVRNNLDARVLAERVSNLLARRIEESSDVLRRTAPSVLKMLNSQMRETQEKISILKDRAKLADSHAETLLDEALAARAAALDEAREKLKRALADFESFRGATVVEWEGRLQEWFRGSSATLNELAKRRRDEWDARVDAIRALWIQGNPSERAKGLEQRERESMKKSR
jgi:hypothetical protein